MASIRRLYEIRNRFGSSASSEKLELLRSLNNHEARSARELKRLHAALCFIRAFPDSLDHHRLAQTELETFEQRVDRHPISAQRQLWDTGIAGTLVHYSFSYEVATWLARRMPGTISIDWEDTDDPPGLDAILTHLLHAAEDEYFDSGNVSAREWIEQASANVPGTDFDWLLAQLKQRHFVPIWSQLYNAADLWLTWDLSRSKFATTHNRYPVTRVATRGHGMRKPTASVKREIMRRIDSIARLSRRDGAKLIDVAMASLAVRHRETFHFNHANASEIYLADVGEGVAIAVFGLQPEYRYPLECTMGYLILANGVPVGYGGSSILFRQVNTGINIFDEYRGSEAAFLWVQVMRVYHQLAGCTRFIANRYQFGAENPEALKSGAFWFYYRLGYRPVLQDIRTLAKRKAAHIRRNKGYRCSSKTLSRLTSCDMQLTLPGAKPSEYFDERWIETSSMLANSVLNDTNTGSRAEAAQHVAKDVLKVLGIRSTRRWTQAEIRGLERLAPFVAAARPATWPSAARKTMRKLLRNKGGRSELDFAAQMANHDYFLKKLRARCRQA